MEILYICYAFNELNYHWMNYADNIESLRAFYSQKGLQDSFDKDSAYLEKAFIGMNQLWLDNFAQINSIKYLMVAEAPLWGQVRKYIYNPETKNSQFFHRSDLGEILNIDIADKKAFLKCCNNIGLLIVDISPFALNPAETKINYGQLSQNEYRQLVHSTIPTYFAKKIELIKTKKSKDIKIFFRYSRVKRAFEDIVEKTFIDKQLIKSKLDIGEIAQNGGGIDRQKLKQIISGRLKTI